MRKINSAGLALVREFEGNKPKAYLDPVGIITVGVGHVVLPKDHIKLGQVISNERVDSLLRDDLAQAEQGVENALAEDVTDNQFAACVSLAFNIGVSGFRKSSIAKFINAGDVILAADRFLLYNRAKGKTLAGLTRRRKAERALYLTEDEDGAELAPVAEPAETTTEKVITTTTTETPNATVEKKSIVSTIVGNEHVKTIASEGVTKLATKATTALTAGSTASATGGSITGKTWLIVLSIVMAVGAIAVVIFVLWHKSSKEKEAARINSDNDRADVVFEKK